MSDELLTTLLRALELADRILARDGLQAIRGEAWTDGERMQIREAIRLAQEQTPNR